MWSAAWIAAAAAAALATTQAASICEGTGVPVPSVVTMQTRAGNSHGEMVIVRPDCLYELVRVSGGQPITVEDPRIERVAGIASMTTDLTLVAPLSEGGDFTSVSPKLKRLSIAAVSGSASAQDFTFPATLQSLSILNTEIPDIARLQVPNAVTTLTLRENKALTLLKSLRLPSSLTSLDLSQNQLAGIDVELPSTLKQVDVTGNVITTLEGIVLPSSLQSFICDQCAIRSVKGVKLPRTLTRLNLGSGQVTTFEIQRSDVAVLSRLAEARTLSLVINQKQCADSTAELVPTKQGSVCVISDARFEELYRGGPPTAPSVPNGDADAPDADIPIDASPSVSDLPAKTSTRASTNETATAAEEATTEEASEAINDSETMPTGALESEAAVESGVAEADAASASSASAERNGGARPSTTRPKSPAGETTTTGAASSSANSLAIVLAVVGTVLVVLIGVVGYRALVVAKNKREEIRFESYTDLLSPQPIAETPRELRKPSEPCEPCEPRITPSPTFFDHDTTMQTHRIDGDAVRLGDVIAQGSRSMVYRGVYNNQSVAIKQLASDTAQDRKAVERFVEEIRVCVTLVHPKIVHSFGASWSSTRDLAAVVEYMAGGDLLALLQSQSGEPSGRDWFEPWTASKIKSKASIASDVAEAVVYLHALATPVVHSELRAQRVLLDLAGNAKLSSFGIHREDGSVDVDALMAREVGAVAWTAPEILRGERGSTGADIYSLGVLLIEMDRCRHPFAHERVFADDKASRRSTPKNPVVMKNTRIAIQVSTGKLRPAPSASCPEPIQQLIARCVAVKATERPTAADVYRQLRALHG